MPQTTTLYLFKFSNWGIIRKITFRFLVNEVVISGPIGPAIYIWLAQKEQLMIPPPQFFFCKTGPGFSKDFNKVMTILANEIIIAGPIGPAMNIWLVR